jgi:hypothetical protein
MHGAGLREPGRIMHAACCWLCEAAFLFLTPAAFLERSRTMADKQSPQRPASPGHESNESNQSTSEQAKTGGTFKTDVSETDDEGTTVREAEVRESDLSEVDRSKETGHG